MNMPDGWQNEKSLIEYLGSQLVAGRLGLFLGAGVSKFFGLPDWRELVSRMAVAVGESRPTSDFDPITKAEALRLKHFPKQEDFNRATRAALYCGISLDFSAIMQNSLLSAIGSLVMASRRGSAAKVITLNFDDLIEIYLEFHGFTTATIYEGCHWAAQEDVVIYHPHGYLPLAHPENSASIVLGTNSFQEVITSDLWRPILATALRQHTFLYLGLSGDDIHLQSHWHDLKSLHAISQDRICYHGVRFTASSSDDDRTTIMQDWGIHTHNLMSHNDLPDFLFRVCQAAREKRMAF